MGNGGAVAQTEVDEPDVPLEEPAPEPPEAPEPPAEPEPAPEPPEEPEAPEAPEEEPTGPPESQAVYEERIKRSERAFQTYTKKIGEVMEEDALNLIECPCCPPMHKGYVDVRDAGRLPEEVVSMVMEFVGLARKTELEPDPETSMCPACKGHGETQTGSLVPSNETRTCRKCQGYGYVPPPEAAKPQNGHVADFHYPAGEAPHPDAEPERDMWGEAQLLPDGRPNPNYGKIPQHKVAVPPWGVTANLTVQDAVA